jgi:hypothetical protein
MSKRVRLLDAAGAYAFPGHDQEIGIKASDRDQGFAGKTRTSNHR